MEKSEHIMAGITDLNNKLLLLRKPIMEKAMSGFSLSEIAYLEYIALHPDANVTRLAAALYMTRGAISKITKKLEQKGMITSYQKPDNKKELYFALTAEGQKIDAVHRQLHQDFIAADQEVFAAFSDCDLTTILRFVEAYNQHLDQDLK
ncbi:MarR family transcriptional regulator [Pseudolactococcus reticulitermitis]|nr:MarR family transcriptional regulator [Lactococcus reticulitermitis]